MKASTLLLIILITPAIFLFSCEPEKTTETTLYLVRHAEKDTTDATDRNPPLTAEGKYRAERLKDLLKAQEVSEIYATELQRTMNTVQPLAELMGITVQQYPYYDYHELLNSISEQKQGKTILIGGHGDTVLPMIDHLRGKRPQKNIGHNEYDKLFKLKIKPDTTLVEVIIF